MENGDLKHIEQLITDLKTNLEGPITSVTGNLERLIIDVKESLEHEVHGIRTEVGEFRNEVKTRFDTQAARMERQGSLLQVGSRWTTRMNGWAEKVDAALEQKDREIAELRERVKRLEDKL
jgi:hypothetical protein